MDKQLLFFPANKWYVLSIRFTSTKTFKQLIKIEGITYMSAIYVILPVRSFLVSDMVYLTYSYSKKDGSSGTFKGWKFHCIPVALQWDIDQILKLRGQCYKFQIMLVLLWTLHTCIKANKEGEVLGLTVLSAKYIAFTDLLIFNSMWFLYSSYILCAFKKLVATSSLSRS